MRPHSFTFVEEPILPSGKKENVEDIHLQRFRLIATNTHSHISKLFNYYFMLVVP